MLARNSRLAEKRRQEELQKNDKRGMVQQQQAMIMMLKMQLEEQQEQAKRELAEAMLARATPSPVESLGERDDLFAKIAELESKLDDMHIVMDDAKAENHQLSK